MHSKMTLCSSAELQGSMQVHTGVLCNFHLMMHSPDRTAGPGVAFLSEIQHYS